MSGPVDIVRLADLLAARLGVSAVELTPVPVACACPVYRAVGADGRSRFVKLVPPDAAARTCAFLAAANCPFLPKPLLADPPAFDGRAVVCLEWKDSVRVNAEDMTDHQLENFAAACRRLSSELATYAGPLRADDDDAPERQYAALAAYAHRHPFAGRLLRPLLALPERDRSYAGRAPVVIHGDFQPKNYGFSGDELSAVYDTDDLALGLACEDAAYAFTERARRAELSSASRRRLHELFRRLVAASDWPSDEWRFAVSHARLRIAARRLAKHPDSFYVAYDICRRDRPLRALASVLEEGVC